MKNMLSFEEQTTKGKTKRFSVISNHSEEVIGTIYYHPAWRHYVIDFLDDTIWSLSCLIEVENKLKELEK